MHLTQNEDQLQDYLDGRLPLQEAQAVEAHLSECPDCNAFFQQWLRLDLELTQALRKRTLSAGFYSRLHHRIELDGALGTAPTDDKRRLETDFQQTWAMPRKSFLRAHFPALLDGLGYGTAAGVGASLLFHLILNLLNTQIKSLNLSSSQLTLGLALAAACVFLLVGFGVAARKQLIGWMEELSA